MAQVAGKRGGIRVPYYNEYLRRLDGAIRTMYETLALAVKEGGVSIAVSAVGVVFCSCVGALRSSTSGAVVKSYLEAVATALATEGIKAEFEVVREDSCDGYREH